MPRPKGRGLGEGRGMAELNVRFDLRFGARLLSGGLAAAMLLAGAAELGSEKVTLTTYYPAPSGIYTKMITTGDAFLARDGGRVGIGTSSPAAGYKLDVRGGAVNVGGGLQVAGILPGAPGLSLSVEGNMNGGDVYLAHPQNGAPRWASQPSYLSGSYVGACNVTGSWSVPPPRCKCNLEETIMLLNSFSIGNAGDWHNGYCSVVGQGTSSVYGACGGAAGGTYGSGSFSCFK
ncbi:MAG: hypothetical protein HY552_02625 [Elusimicrobia bacterium]|nr:hypothetical protein [Elusimicrobiota bacterium]